MKLPLPDVLASRPTSTFINLQGRELGLIITEAALSSIAVAFVAARVYTRLKIVRLFDTDDMLILLAVAPMLGWTVCTLLSNFKHGHGKQAWSSELDEILGGRKLMMISQAMFGLAVGLSKLSVLLFMRRLFRGSGSRILIVLNSLLILVSTSFAIFVVMDVFHGW
jgi:hypothetical protein